MGDIHTPPPPSSLKGPRNWLNGHYSNILNLIIIHLYLFMKSYIFIYLFINLYWWTFLGRSTCNEVRPCYSKFQQATWHWNSDISEMKWRQATRLCHDPTTGTGKSKEGSMNFIVYKFDSNLGALSIVFEIVKYSRHSLIWSYGLNESKYPGMPLLSAILVTLDSYKRQPLRF